MPSALEERITRTKEKIAKLEQQQRLQKRNEKEAQRKKDARRNYIIGTLVTKHFHDEVVCLEPGTNAENTTTFGVLEAFLMTLAADAELMTKLKVKATEMASAPISAK